MPVAWYGTVKSFIEKADAGVLPEQILQGYTNAYGVPKPQEVSSWPPTIEALLPLIDQPRFHALWMLFELAMPGGMHRADVIIIGGTDGSPKGLVLEFKQWSGFSGFVSTKQRRIKLYSNDSNSYWHPMLQAQRYARKLAIYSHVGKMIAWDYCALLPNMSISGVDRLRKSCALTPEAKSALFGKGNLNSLREKLESLLPSSIFEHYIHSLIEAPYRPAEDLGDILTQYADSIARTTSAVLGNSGAMLTVEQRDIAVQAYKTVLSRKKTGEQKPVLFLVEGGPGTGKTFIAAMLLLRALHRGMNVRMGVRGARLYAFLEECFDEAYDGLAECLVHLQKLGAKNYEHLHDLVICDEAQRMSQTEMKTILERTPTVIFFFDEKQRLSNADEGTSECFTTVANETGHEVVSLQLSKTWRCKGEAGYHAWAEKLISGQISDQDCLSSQFWLKDYGFEMTESCAEMIERLNILGKAHKVITVASFTESPGSWESSMHKANIRINENGLILTWRMHNEEYIEPWMHGRAEDLDKVCSIYGTQGFESDYVGVIWGRDYVFRNGQFVTGDAKFCYDDRGKTSPLVKIQRKGVAHAWCDGALELLQNRYRIFLTRGRLGTIVYCEDEETRHYLRRCLN